MRASPLYDVGKLALAGGVTLASALPANDSMQPQLCYRVELF